MGVTVTVQGVSATAQVERITIWALIIIDPQPAPVWVVVNT